MTRQAMMLISNGLGVLIAGSCAAIFEEWRVTQRRYSRPPQSPPPPPPSPPSPLPPSPAPTPSCCSAQGRPSRLLLVGPRPSPLPRRPLPPPTVPPPHMGLLMRASPPHYRRHAHSPCSLDYCRPCSLASLSLSCRPPQAGPQVGVWRPAPGRVGPPVGLVRHRGTLLVRCRHPHHPPASTHPHHPPASTRRPSPWNACAEARLWACVRSSHAPSPPIHDHPPPHPSLRPLPPLRPPPPHHPSTTLHPPYAAAGTPA